MTETSVGPMRPDPKNTLTGLRHRLDYQFREPPRLTREEYLALDTEARYAHDSARLGWFGAGFLLTTGDTIDLLRSVKGYLRTTNPYAVGERNVVLDGPANVGKTTMLLRLAAAIEGNEVRMNPTYRGQGRVPVVYIEVAPKATPKAMAAAILDFFGIPVGERRTQRELVNNAVEAMVAKGTRLLIVDELQMLRLEGSQGDDAMDTLKAIINSAGVVTVLSGIDLTSKMASRAAEQIMGRGEVRHLRPFSYASDADRQRWAGLVTSFTREMRLLDGQPDALVKFADPLHALTQGRIGNLRRVLSRAMSIAVDEKPTPEAPEVILEEHIFGSAGASAVLPGTSAAGSGKKGRSEVA